VSKIAQQVGQKALFTCHPERSEGSIIELFYCAIDASLRSA
jgi:hypothetical protein